MYSNYYQIKQIYDLFETHINNIINAVSSGELPLSEIPLKKISEIIYSNFNSNSDSSTVNTTSTFHKSIDYQVHLLNQAIDKNDISLTCSVFNLMLNTIDHFVLQEKKLAILKQLYTEHYMKASFAHEQYISAPNHSNCK